MANNPLANKFVAKAHWNFSTTNAAGSAESISAHNGPIMIPDGALITKAYYHVGTTLSDNGDDSTQISLGYTGALAAFQAEIAISDGTAGTLNSDISGGTGTNGVAAGQWDTGIHGTLVGMGANLGADAAHDSALEVIALNTATMIHSTADVELLLTVGSTGVHTLNEGNLTLFVEYVLTEDLS